MPSPEERRLALYPMVRRDAPSATDAAVVARIIGPIVGPVFVIETPATIATVSSVPAAAVTTTLLVANASRRQASFFNSSPSSFLFLKLGAAGTSISFTVRVGPQSFYEIPSPGFTGIVTGEWSAAVGACLVTELT